MPTRVTPAPSERRAAADAAGRAPANLTASLNGGSGAAAPARRTTPPPAREAARAAPSRASGRWAVQVGAFKDEKVASDWLTEVNRRFRTQFANAERNVQTAGEWYRSRFTGLTEDAAKAACEALSERRVTCMVVRPD